VFGTFQSVSEQHLQSYVTKFAFRWNNRSALGVEDFERAAELLKGAAGLPMAGLARGHGENVRRADERGHEHRLRDGLPELRAFFRSSPYSNHRGMDDDRTHVLRSQRCPAASPRVWAQSYADGFHAALVCATTIRSQGSHGRS
jgi:hypothetical protein